MSALLNDLLACETAVWQALVDGDAQADEAALSPDFLGVYPSGFSDRAGHVSQLADGPSIARFSLSQAQIRPLPGDHALLSYHAVYQRAGSDLSEAMFVSSLWRKEGTLWVNLFSQDTPCA